MEGVKTQKKKNKKKFLNNSYANIAIFLFFFTKSGDYLLIYIIILFLLIAGISLLFIPFYISFQLTKDRETTQKNISIKWIFLSIHYDYDGKVYAFSCLNKSLFKKLKKKKKVKKKEKKIKKDKKEDFLKTISLLKE